MPSTTVVTTSFVPLATTVLKARGYENLPLTVVPHPLADLTPSQIEARADAAIETVIRAITETPAAKASAAEEVPTRIEVAAAPDDLEAIYQEFAERNWEDGLPFVPPTPQRVEQMLGKWAGQADTVVGLVPPQWRIATLRSIAANAVMAGCLPEYFPVVVAALRASLDDKFNLFGVQNTTHPVAPLIIVNGPIRQRIGLNSGHNCFGHGFRANAAIGRAFRLCLLNIGGARPGFVDKATHGTPAKFSYCVAENEEANPWEPLHVELGFRADQSTVTIVGGEAPHNVNDHSSQAGLGILQTAVSTMISLGSNDPYLGIGRHNPLLVLGPEHAAKTARSGYTKRDVKQFLFDNARNSVGELKKGGSWAIKDWKAGFAPDDDNAVLPIVEKPDDFLVIVAGGAGLHSLYIPTFGLSTAITAAIEA